MSVYMSVATIAMVISVSKCGDHAFVASSHARASRGWLIGWFVVERLASK